MFLEANTVPLELFNYFCHDFPVFSLTYTVKLFQDVSKMQETRKNRQRAVRFSTAADCLGAFAREKKKRIAREDAEPQRPPAGRQVLRIQVPI
jgi:hypothetical protein